MGDVEPELSERRHISRKNKKTTSIHEHTQSSKGEAFCSTVVGSVTLNKINKGKGVSSIILDYVVMGSDYAKNEAYNNNNKRQMSHLHLIDLCNGSKIIEVDNQTQKDGQKSETICRKEFMESLQKNRFKSFFERQKTTEEDEPASIPLTIVNNY